MKKIFICTGDISGDLHAANLVKTIKQQDRNICIISVGGNKLEQVSDIFLFNMVELDLHGFWEPFKKFLKVKEIMHNIIFPFIKSQKPDLFLPIDFYGFNIRIAEFVKSLNIPVVYFISPQIWASRSGRIYKIKKFVDHMLVIFPFEKQIYEKENIKVDFVGHPFIDLIPENTFKKTINKNPVIGLFPGSRKQVIRWNLPIMEKASFLIQKKIPNAKFYIVSLNNLLNNHNTNIEILYDMDYYQKTMFDIAITTSGTVTLENALLGIPMIVMYHLPWWMFLLIKSMVKVNYISIINLITDKHFIPEFIQRQANPENIANNTIQLLENKNKLEEIKQEFFKLRKLFGPPGAYNRASRIIFNYL